MGNYFEGAMKKYILLALALLLVSCSDNTVDNPVDEVKLAKSTDTLTANIVIEGNEIKFYRTDKLVGVIRVGYVPEIGETITLDGDFRFTKNFKIGGHGLGTGDLSNFPTVEGNAGKYLATDGVSLFWESISKKRIVEDRYQELFNEIKLLKEQVAELSSR
jgi:hypothetical protein